MSCPLGRIFQFIKRLKDLGLTLMEMHELQHIHQIHGTNKTMLYRLLELLDKQVTQIDERTNNLIRLKEDILSFQTKIRQKLNGENGLPERRTS